MKVCKQLPNLGSNRPVIVISAVKLREAGPLSILKDVLSYVQKALANTYEVVVLVYRREVVEAEHYPDVHFIECPEASRSFAHRLYYEYVVFKRVSRLLDPYLWLSLHDLSPRVKAERQAVYCHNAAMFYRPSLRECLTDPKFALFVGLYRRLYALNIHSNRYVIVQQNWLRSAFCQAFNLRAERVVVAHPSLESDLSASSLVVKDALAHEEGAFTFFYPCMPRVFKNIEVLCEAIVELSKTQVQVSLWLTLSGSENSYARALYRRFRHVKQIRFLGRLSRDEVFQHYRQCDAVVFPSRLESWGLPITEAKAFQRPLILADLPYAHETLGEYSQALFFSADDPEALRQAMVDGMAGKFSAHSLSQPPKTPFAADWHQLFNLLLEDKSRDSTS